MEDAPKCENDMNPTSEKLANFTSILPIVGFVSMQKKLRRKSQNELSSSRGNGWNLAFTCNVHAEREHLGRKYEKYGLQREPSGGVLFPFLIRQKSGMCHATGKVFALINLGRWTTCRQNRMCAIYEEHEAYAMSRKIT